MIKEEAITELRQLTPLIKRSKITITYHSIEQLYLNANYNFISRRQTENFMVKRMAEDLEKNVFKIKWYLREDFKARECIDYTGIVESHNSLRWLELFKFLNPDLIYLPN